MRIPGMMARLSGVLGVLIVTTMLGSLVSTARAADSNADDVASIRRRLRQAARLMTGIFRGCQDTCCSTREEGRASALLAGEGSPTAVHASLLALLSTPLDPASEALALRWLSRVGDATDLPRLEARLKNSRRAWYRPSSPVGQAVRCYPVRRWQAVPVSEAALVAIRELVHGDFTHVDQYRRWRKQHPDVLDLVSYWDGRVPALADAAACSEQVHAMVKRDPRLLLALAAHRGGRGHPGQASCPTFAQVRAAFAGDGGGGGLVGYLAKPSRWLRVEPERSGVITWLLAHATRLLLPQDADALESLLTAPQFSSDTHKAQLVLAAVALDPSRRGRLLSAWVDKLESPPPAFFAELIKRDPEDPRIVAWLRPDHPGHCVDELRPKAVLTALTRSRPAARKAMAVILRDPEAKLMERPNFVALLAEAALAMGGPSDLRDCARELHYRRCRKMQQQQAEAAEAAIARELPRCIEVLKTWLR